MNRPKYTPGPWRYQARLSGSENHKGFAIRDETGYWIVDVFPRDEDGAEGGANARLIAQAPAMAELVAAFVSYLEDHSRSPRRYEAILAEARAILRKIEGEEA